MTPSIWGSRILAWVEEATSEAGGAESRIWWPEGEGQGSDSVVGGRRSEARRGEERPDQRAREPEARAGARGERAERREGAAVGPRAQRCQDAVQGGG